MKNKVDDEIGIKIANEILFMNFLIFMEMKGVKDFKVSTIKKLYGEYIDIKDIIWNE